MKQSGVKLWLSVGSNETVQQKVVEAVACSSILIKMVKEMLSDTCRLLKRGALDAVLQPLEFQRLLSQWSARIEIDIEKR